ncbi:MAG: GNAT family N-acetyltransferase [Candidatus Eremiobacteraeota bacterium]|nr:GNAT family N-acetyltransferase [Candidatus Eremiobacteraeota bacterium]
MRAAGSGDVASWSRLRRLLWPDIDDAEAANECTQLLADPSYAVFVSESDQRLSGFIEVRLRPYADGCDTSPVGYIEGWYVEPASRRSGIGRRLVAAAEQWARARGCSEMASDSLLDNENGRRAHEHLGYAEVEQAVRFRKDLRTAT